MVGESVEVLCARLPLPVNLVLVRLVRIYISRVRMVCPHQVEFHLAVVLGFQETVVQNTLKERPSLIPVPVEYECVHAIFQCRLYYLLLCLWACLVQIAPQRHSRLPVSLILWLSLIHSLPFALPVVEYVHLVLKARLVVIGGPHISRHVVFSVLAVYAERDSEQ